MKKFILRWREKKTRIVRSVTVTVDDQDAWLFRNNTYRVKKGCKTILRSPATHGGGGDIQLSHDIMGPPPEGHHWCHKDGDSLNCRRANYYVGTK